MAGQPNNDMALRMECLRLACATSDAAMKGDDIVKKAETFVDYIEGPAPSIITPKMVLSS